MDEDDDRQVVDPVCGLAIDRDDAADSVSYEGDTYYFCSEHCREAFETEPDRYAG